MEHNNFPLSSLPRALGNIITGMHDACRFPVNFLAASLLWALSVAVGKTCRLAVKSTWIVYANLFIGLVAPKGGVKSPAAKFVLPPLTAANKAALAKDDPHQILLENATMEATHMALYKNAYGIGVYKDELKGLFGEMNRYRAGNGDESAWLSLYNNGAIIINRKTDKTVYVVDDPYLALLGTIQPDNLASIKAESKYDGLWERFCWAFCEVAEPHRWNLTGDDPTGLYSADLNYIINLLLEAGGFFSGELLDTEFHLSQAAAAALEEWYNACALNCRGDEVLSRLRVKNGEQTLRIALLLQAVGRVLGDVADVAEITQETALKAISIGEYFFAEAKNVAELNYQSSAPVWSGDLPDRFTTAEAVDAAAKYNISESTVKHAALKDTAFFAKVKHGIYEKVKTCLPCDADDSDATTAMPEPETPVVDLVTD